MPLTTIVYGVIDPTVLIQLMLNYVLIIMVAHTNYLNEFLIPALIGQRS